jgi:FdhD protein
MPGSNTRSIRVHKVFDGQASRRDDILAVEEPLEIRLRFKTVDGWAEKNISITMRTPGHDFELAVGFLFSEGILHNRGGLQKIDRTGQRRDRQQNCNIVSVPLRSSSGFDPERLQRHFYTTSSCGVCGKSSLEALRIINCSKLSEDRPIIAEEVILKLGEQLRRSQSVFDQTGGLHAAGLFDTEGDLVSLREDVGRHNAIDKLIGEQLLANRVPLPDHLMMVSGRTSFEIMQKALMAGIPVVAAVSAPSSLAVELAAEFGMTLLGFVRGNRFNIYTGAQRIQLRHPGSRSQGPSQVADV